MSGIQKFDPAGLFNGAPLMSQVVRANGMVYTAGQVGVDGNGYIPIEYEDQIPLALECLRKCLQIAGAKIEDIVHLRYYIVDYDPTLKSQPHYNHLVKWLSGHRPCTTLAPVPALAKPEYKFEIEAVAVASSLPAQVQDLKKSVDVVVVGAGLSGLEAARNVQAAGLSVLVLEARDRVGGKTWSKNTDGRSKVDVGAAWINDSNQSRMWGMAQKYGLETVVQNTVGDCILYEENTARRFSNGDTPPFPDGGKEEVAAIRDLLDKLSLELDIESPANGDAVRVAQYDSETVEEFVVREGFGKAAQAAVAIWCRVMFGLEASDLSALYYLWYVRSAGGLLVTRGEKKHGGQYLRMRNGTQSFSKHLAAELKSGAVRLSTPVKKITQTGSGVLVEADNGLEIQCKRAIISVPSPSYKWIAFEPPLPEEKQLLSERVNFGHTLKVILVYPTSWWREYGLCGFAQSSAGPISVCRDTSVDPDGQYSLTCFVSAEPGKRWIKLSKEARKTSVVEQIAKMFGPACAVKSTDPSTLEAVTEIAKNPAEIFYHDWSADEWSQGCPCPALPPRPNGILDLAPALKSSVSALHFAGTETSNIWRGYMEGAVRSGERAADEVVNAIRAKVAAKI
ncbi:related to amine oxidase [flavin-containing] B [Phialocephala subalpina]|uniref:Amine oxidase n=1 Tax=Phialocephala subalpina TaxID=576137 RepID=A0A1L7X3Y0_9HELO|nr:related to amine oxidase [flavin-containing] B [Phialocephala subalpina]